MAFIKDIAGKTFGLLKAVSREGTGSKGGTTWRCQCACGKESIAHYGNLVSGNTKSCGCYNLAKIRERNTSHGLAKTPEYRIWNGIIARCYNKRDSFFKNYGGRGIGVCERWRNSFESFYSDMGPRPSNKYSIDRIDNNKGYSPENCRWATDIEQANNKRNNLMLSAYGKTMTVMQWSRETGIPASAIRARMSREVKGHFAVAPSKRCSTYKWPLCVRMLESYTPEERKVTV